MSSGASEVRDNRPRDDDWTTTGVIVSQRVRAKARPDDRLREAIHRSASRFWIASELTLLAMTRQNTRSDSSGEVATRAACPEAAGPRS
jgi:hypothetical protein